MRAAFDSRSILGMEWIGGPSLTDGLRSLATTTAPLFAFLARVLVATWCLLVGAIAHGAGLAAAWWTRPAREAAAQAAELDEIVAGARDQAEFAEANGMLVSAAVWRQLADDDEPEQQVAS